jgi:hypothetical protein
LGNITALIEWRSNAFSESRSAALSLIEQARQRAAAEHPAIAAAKPEEAMAGTIAAAVAVENLGNEAGPGHRG